MTTTVFADWQPEFTAGWNRQPMNLPHRLLDSGLFTREALSDLIAGYPKSGYALAQTSRSDQGQRRWREGDMTGVSGHEVMETIAGGSMWLNLMDVARHAPRYHRLLEAAYAELAQHVPGFAPHSLKMGILVSSPNAQVPYHCDLPGQALWQIAGRKRVYVYPPRPPFLERQALEDIAYSGLEFKLGYQKDFDAEAEVFDLEPGRMLTWPLNAPHRIDNHDCLNISVTTEHWTDANVRSQKVTLANAVLRHRLGWSARSREASGASYAAKTLLQAAWRRSPWAARVQREHRPITFRLVPGSPGTIVDLATAAP